MPAAASPKHYPAPWWIHGQFDGECSVEILSGDPTNHMNALTVFEVEPFGEDWTEEEIAHVHIASASLDLLKAAKDKLADCKLNGECADAALKPGEYCSEGCAALAAAVAKAEGRSAC